MKGLAAVMQIAFIRTKLGGRKVCDVAVGDVAELQQAQIARARSSRSLLGLAVTRMLRAILDEKAASTRADFRIDPTSGRHAHRACYV